MQNKRMKSSSSSRKAILLLFICILSASSLGLAYRIEDEISYSPTTIAPSSSASSTVDSIDAKLTITSPSTEQSELTTSSDTLESDVLVVPITKQQLTSVTTPSPVFLDNREEKTLVDASSSDKIDVSAHTSSSEAIATSEHDSQPEQDDVKETEISDHKEQAKASKLSATTTSSSTEDEEDEEEDVSHAEEEEEDDEDEENEIANNICTAQYFVDRVVPEDYPHPVTKNVKHINETIERIDRLYKFGNTILANFNPLLREMGSRVADFLIEADLQPKCLASFFRIIRGISTRKPWAMSFLDSSGSLMVGGFQEGRFVSFGEFEQCLSIQSKGEEEMIAGAPIRGRYCLVKPVIPLPGTFVRGEKIVKSEVEIMNRILSNEYIETYLGLFKYIRNTILKLGLCLPDSCTPLELENALNKFFVRKSGFSIQIGPHCSSASDPVLIDNYQTVSIVIFCLLGILVVTSTLYELIHRLLHDAKHRTEDDLPIAHTLSRRICTPTSFSRPKMSFSRRLEKFQRQSTMSQQYFEKPLMLQALTMFSAIRNTRVLFDTPPPSRKNSIDTLRLLLIMFFFVSNAYLYTILVAPMLLKRFYVLGPVQLFFDKKYFFIRMYYMINCFIALSGISMVLSFRRQRFNYFKFVGLTYLRYMIPILFTIGVIFVLPLLGSGPMWYMFDDTITKSCRENFWGTVLFYNNFNSNVETVCNFTTVFVSLVFQLKLIAPLILLFLSRFSLRTSFIILGFMLVITMAMNVSLRVYFNYKIPYELSQMSTFQEIKSSVVFYNFNPLPYLSSLIYGIIMGFIIKYRVQFRHRYVLGFGLCTMVAFIAGIIYLENMDFRKNKLNKFNLITMMSMGRIPMLTFISWIIYASEERHMGILKRYLSSVVWIPLSQLSYGFYISSLIVNSYRLFSIHQNTTLAPQTMFRAIVSDAVICFLFSYMLHILVVQPMKNIHYVLGRCSLSLHNYSVEEEDNTFTRASSPISSIALKTSISPTSSQHSSDDNNNRRNEDFEDCRL